jgi:hypothetical protein
MITLAEDADLEFRFASPVSLARLRLASAVEDLVTLAAGRRDAANEVWLTREGLIDNERNERASVRLLARRRHQPAPSDERFIPGVDGRFRIGETELGDLLTRWLKLQATDGQVLSEMLKPSPANALDTPTSGPNGWRALGIPAAHTQGPPLILSPYWAAESLRWVLIAALLPELAVPDSDQWYVQGIFSAEIWKLQELPLSRFRGRTWRRRSWRSAIYAMDRDVSNRVK